MSIHDILAEVAAFSVRTGLSEATIGARATGNARLVDRLRRREAQTERDIARLRAFMSSVPSGLPAVSGLSPDGFLPGDNNGDAPADMQGGAE